MKKLLPMLAVAATTATAQAQETGWHARTLTDALLNSAIFGAAAIAMLLIGFKVFDKAVTQIDLEKEIQKGNVAAGILGAAVLIALAIVLAAAIS